MDFSKRTWMSRVGIVVIAAVLVEIISIVQYNHLRRMMAEETKIRSQVVLGSMVGQIEHTLELTEATMRENLWEVKRGMAHPDSVYRSLERLVDDNPHVAGSCLAFEPYYFSSKGRLFEPYVRMEKDGSFLEEQIAGPDHDYTKSQQYILVKEHLVPIWTDPYFYGPDSLAFTTYSIPVMDGKGRFQAFCGLDVDLSWLGDTLNAHQPYPSSFALLLTKEGKLVAGPSDSVIPSDKVDRVVDIVNGTLPESALRGFSIRTMNLQREPYWQLVQVSNISEEFARMRRLRLQQVVLMLLALAILIFMIERYAHNEKKLRIASEAQARISGELAVAGRIQNEMLPKTFPSFVYGSLEPAREVGGDLFDFFIRDGKLFFCIGDVTGKGVPAAMLMSVAHSLFRMISQKVQSPSVILRSLNTEISRGNDSNMFLTFFVGCLDLYSGELEYASAGHDKPFVIADGIDLLPSQSNLPLGVFPNTVFQQHSCTLSPGTTLLLYTDGLTEAKNVDRKQFGRTGVRLCLNAFLSGTDHTLPYLVSSLSEAAHRFAGEAPQSDDLTMLALRFAPEHLIRDGITLTNDTADISRLSLFIKDFLGKIEIDKKTAAGIRLALEEAVVNVMNYAYPSHEEGMVVVRADSNDKEVRFTVIDSGIPFDPTTVLEPDTTLDAQNRPIGGLGIFLTRKMMDSISYIRHDGQNVLYLTKSIL